MTSSTCSKHLNKKTKIQKFSATSLVFLVLFSSYMGSVPWIQADSSGTTNSTIQSFSNFTCAREIGSVMLTGQYTNGDTPYKVIFLKMLVLDKNGHTIATGNGNIPDIGAYEIKTFNAITRFSGNFSSCTVQIDNLIPK
ncbi:MAG TPA: FxLYD domain-containing protein [Candidatus Nitrosotalea sp.]|nr:FxLYD domain-containing protein [Candidatus Nitrosotalea sp.]